MPRIRTLKPEILEDANTAGLSDSAFRLFASAIVLADDYGNLRADERWLTGQIWWAHREPPRVAEFLRELCEAQLISVYEVREQLYMTIRSWSKHQRIDNASKPRVPKPCDGSPISAEEFRESPRNAAGPRPPTTTTTTEREVDNAAGRGDQDAPSASLPGLDLDSDAPLAKPKRARKPKQSSGTANDELETQSAKLVLSRLGERNGVKYTGSVEHIRLIRALFADGLTEVDLRSIVAYCADSSGLGWSRDEEMKKYLRPETLFGAKTHAKYLDAARSWAAARGHVPAKPAANDAPDEIVVPQSSFRELVLNGRTMIIDDNNVVPPRFVDQEGAA